VSAGEGPGGRDDRTRRVDDADATRAIDPDATRQVDAGATRRIDDPGATRRVDAAGSADPTQVMDPTAGDDDDGYVTVPARTPGEPGLEDDEVVVADEEEPERNRGRDWAIGLGGVVVGVLLAVIVAFLAGGDDPLDGEAAAAEQVAALEAERDELTARNEALEAQLVEAEAAAGRTDDDLAAQRSALDDRAGALDDRADALDDREAALNDRERSLDERESALAERERQAPGDGGGDDGGDGGVEDLIPDVDADDVEGFFDRLVDRIRDLF
jgi:hypothetical protein